MLVFYEVKRALMRIEEYHFFLFSQEYASINKHAD
jgi:hypothetical protein